MTGFKEEVTTWFRSRLSEEVRMSVCAYGDNMAMVLMEGRGLCLHHEKIQAHWHAFLNVREGELRMTVNGERLGFEAPVYVDFLDGYGWDDVTFPGHFRACFVVVEQHFFMEGSTPLQSKISRGMISFAQSPFLSLCEGEARRLWQLEDVMVSVLEEGSHYFRRELLQTLVCAWQYELWNIVFARQQASPSWGGKTQWKNAASHFLCLAHMHCREHHEVGWYAARMGVNADTLSAALKRLYGKTGSTILNELLMSEAKVSLRNPNLSVQDVAELLCFSDQSSFGKFFKRHSGMSPVVFRRQVDGN